MALQKQSVNLNFAQGIDTKSDPKQVSMGKFLNLENSIFDELGELKKRYGFEELPSLPDESSLYATTFNGNLTTIGTSFLAYSEGSKTWVNKGFIQPLKLSTLPLVRSNTNQSQCDSVVSTNGLVCTVFTDQNPASLGSKVYKYVIADSTTGQNIIAPTVIPVTSGTVTGSPRVFLLKNNFMIVFTNVITAADHLQYVAISTINPSNVTTNVNISSTYDSSTGLNFDGFVANNNLYLAWNGSDVGGAIRMTYIDSTLLLHNTVIFATSVATLMSVTADTTGSTAVIYATFYDDVASEGYTLAVNQNLVTLLAPTLWTSSSDVLNVTSSAQNGVNTIYYEFDNGYTYDSAVKTNFIKHVTVTSAGVVGSETTLIRSVGLASKSFIVNGVIYFLGIYYSLYQPTYFLFNEDGKIVSRFAYENAGPYLSKGLPNVTITGTIAAIPYLVKDLIQAVNKNTNVPAGSQVNGIYSQLGINLAYFDIQTTNISSSEIANAVNVTGGFLWSYDGYSPVENNFFLWPDSVECTTTTGSGGLVADTYYYQFTYEWSDNNGNINRSAPSIPVKQVTTTASSTNTLKVPTLRLTYKTNNPVKIVGYRWSVLQQTYYQFTSITTPVLNDLSVDFVTIVDTQAQSAILGNNIIYTNGGVIENVSPPACNAITLFDDRVFLLDAEDGTVWYSKQIIPGVPVEMSDLFNIYVAPTIGASGSTGNVACIFPMDEKMIFFKKDAIYYMNGSGPDNTGSNSQYSQPIFVTSTVGSVNQKSIVFIPNGLMFQSDKGIWLLGRDLSTSYIGAEVEAYNDAVVESVLTVPGTNQVRFTLDNGMTLMYDYYVGQWGTFTGIPAISSTLYQNLHTYINSYGQVFQENPGSYLDGSSPVLMRFKTSWIKLAGLQGYQRAYFFYLMGTYISPHKLNVQLAYDYSLSPAQQIVISPTNFSPPYGEESPYGFQSPYGGSETLEQWQVYFKRQTCQAFQISVSELFDPTYSTMAGAGLTLSSINAVIGVKRGYNPIRRNSVG